MLGKKGDIVTTGYTSKGFSHGSGRAGRFKQAYLAIDQRYPDLAHGTGSAPAGTMVCAGCHAVYEHKHWHFSDADYTRLQAEPDTVTIPACPGCLAIATRDYKGELTILGPPPVGAKDERRQRLFDTEALGKQGNPIARIGELTVSPGRWHVYTTTAALAVRLGTELQKAFGGELSIDKPPQADLARVRWIEAPTHVD